MMTRTQQFHERLSDVHSKTAIHIARMIEHDYGVQLDDSRHNGLVAEIDRIIKKGESAVPMGSPNPTGVPRTAPNRSFEDSSIKGVSEAEEYPRKVQGSIDNDDPDHPEPTDEEKAKLEALIKTDKFALAKADGSLNDTADKVREVQPNPPVEPMVARPEQHSDPTGETETKEPSESVVPVDDHGQPDPYHTGFYGDQAEENKESGKKKRKKEAKEAGYMDPADYVNDGSGNAKGQ